MEMRVPSFMLGRDPGRGYFPPQRKNWCSVKITRFGAYLITFSGLTKILRPWRREGSIHPSLPPVSGYHATDYTGGVRVYRWRRWGRNRARSCCCASRTCSKCWPPSGDLVIRSTALSGTDCVCDVTAHTTDVINLARCCRASSVGNLYGRAGL